MVSTLWIQKPRPILVQSWVSCPHPVGARKDTWASLTFYMRSRAHSPSRFPPHKENVFSASKNQWPQCLHPASSRGPENTHQITKLHGSSISNIFNYISKPFFFFLIWGGNTSVQSFVCNLMDSKWKIGPVVLIHCCMSHISAICKGLCEVPNYIFQDEKYNLYQKATDLNPKHTCV